MALRGSRRSQPESVSAHAGAAPSGAPTVAERPSGAGRKLGELLIDRKLLTAAQVQEALVQQPASGKRLGTLLVELGALDERDLYETLAEQLGVPLVDLRSEQPSKEAVARVPEDVARATTSIPLREVDEGLVVVLADPLDDQARSRLSQATPSCRSMAMRSRSSSRASRSSSAPISPSWSVNAASRAKAAATTSPTSSKGEASGHRMTASVPMSPWVVTMGSCTTAGSSPSVRSGVGCRHCSS